MGHNRSSWSDILLDVPIALGDGTYGTPATGAHMPVEATSVPHDAKRATTWKSLSVASVICQWSPQ